MSARTELAKNATERAELLRQARRVMQELLVLLMLPDEAHLARLDKVAAGRLLDRLDECRERMTQLQKEYAELVALA